MPSTRTGEVGSNVPTNSERTIVRRGSSRKLDTNQSMVAILWIISLVNKSMELRSFLSELVPRNLTGIVAVIVSEPRTVSSKRVDYTVLDKPHSLNFLDLSF